MATNLLDTIQQNSSTLAGQQQGVTDQSSNLATLLRAKSGKSLGGGDIAASNLGEQQAVSNTNTVMQNQIAPQAQIANQQLAQQSMGQEQATNIQKQDIAQQGRFNTLKTQLQTNSILNDFERGKGQLSLDQDKASANQIATNLRLQNNQYVDQLGLEGARSRLDDASQFQDQLAQTTFGQNLDLLKQKLGDQNILAASSRDFKRAVGDIDINSAYEIFSNEQAGNKTRQLYGAAGAGTTAGIGAYGAYSESESKKDYAAYNKAGGEDSYSTWQAKQEGNAEE